MLERIRPGLVSGAIVLAHDALGPGALREDCAQTVGLVPCVAALAHAREIRLVALETDDLPDEADEVEPSRASALA
jgi:peptidoglycan-N-acetylglucosamine deacetylase